MGIELIPGGMDNVHGKFYEAELFEDLPDEQVDQFSEKFPPLQKLRLPGQWGYEE
jgi:hypothetical protein